MKRDEREHYQPLCKLHLANKNNRRRRAEVGCISRSRRHESTLKELSESMIKQSKLLSKYDENKSRLRGPAAATVLTITIMKKKRSHVSLT